MFHQTHPKLKFKVAIKSCSYIIYPAELPKSSSSLPTSLIKRNGPTQRDYLQNFPHQDIIPTFYDLNKNHAQCTQKFSQNQGFVVCLCFYENTQVPKIIISLKLDEE